MLQSYFTALALVPPAPYKLLLENKKSLWPFQHYHRLNDKAPARRGKNSGQEFLALGFSVHSRGKKLIEGVQHSSS